MDASEMAGMMELLGEVKGVVEKDVKGFKVEEVEKVWGRKEKERVVFVFGNSTDSTG